MDIVLNQIVGTICNASSNKRLIHSTGAPNVPAIMLVTKISGEIAVAFEMELTVDSKLDLKPSRRARPNKQQETTTQARNHAKFM